MPQSWLWANRQGGQVRKVAPHSLTLFWSAPCHNALTNDACKATRHLFRIYRMEKNDLSCFGYPWRRKTGYKQSKKQHKYTRNGSQQVSDPLPPSRLPALMVPTICVGTDLRHFRNQTSSCRRLSAVRWEGLVPCKDF